MHRSGKVVTELYDVLADEPPEIRSVGILQVEAVKEDLQERARVCVGLDWWTDVI